MKMSKSDRKHSHNSASGTPANEPEIPRDTEHETVKLKTEEYESLQGEAERWKEHAMRAQAEYDNTKKRLEARQVEAVMRSSERVVAQLFPVLDDLSYAIAHTEETESGAVGGITAIRTKLLGVLEREGVVEIDPLNKPFDHDTAQAVSIQENKDVPDNTVIQVLQKGYELHGRVLRPAMVIVSSGGETAS